MFSFMPWPVRLALVTGAVWSSAMAQQQLLHHQPGLDRLAQADIVGDQQVGARQRQGPHHRVELVVLDGDAAAERRLQRAGVGAGDRAPADRVEERIQPLRVIEPLRVWRRQRRAVQDAGRLLQLPDDPQLVAERVFLHRRQGDQMLALPRVGGHHVDRLRGALDVDDDPAPVANADQLPRLGCGAYVDGGGHAAAFWAAWSSDR
jgi:hypothetical protein